MRLKDVKKKLEDHGYLAKGDEKSILVGREGQAPDESGIGFFDFFCSIELINNKALVDSGKAALPEIEEFSSSTSAVNFIKKKFPL